MLGVAAPLARFNSVKGYCVWRNRRRGKRWGELMGEQKLARMKSQEHMGNATWETTRQELVE